MPLVLDEVFEAAGAFERSHSLLRLAYSVKTNPRREILLAALGQRLYAEAISPAEMDRALECGFRAGDVVYNGPFPATTCRVAPGYIFADSVQAFRNAAGIFAASVTGVRLRPPGIRSRFGVAAQDFDELVRAVRESRRPELGVSFHVRPEDYGSYTWRTLVCAVLDLAARLELESGARVTVFDVGGGKRPEEFDEAVAAGDFDWLQSQVPAGLEHVREIFCEPGQALATSIEAVVAPVLEVRERKSGLEIVVDAGYPDVPQIATFEHRLFHAHDGTISPVARNGFTRILGRTCLEYDVIASNAALSACCEGDAVIIGDAGAYDASMHFAFSEGAQCGAA